MKKILYLFVVAVSAMVLMHSCNAYKDVLYLQTSDSIDFAMAKGLYDARIMPKDILNIYVMTPENKEASSIFNFNRDAVGASGGQGTIGYLVNNEGKVNFPVLGEIYVKGMTVNELEEYIAGRLNGTYLKSKPVVKVELSSYSVTVIGEVGHSGVFKVDKEKANIFEILAMAGDMNIQAKRDEVKILREDAMGNKNVYVVDLTQADIVNSPFYQLQQNDIIYVRPNNSKARNSRISNEVTVWFSSLSLLMSVTAFLINLLK